MLVRQVRQCRTLYLVLLELPPVLLQTKRRKPEPHLSAAGGERVAIDTLHREALGAPTLRKALALRLVLLLKPNALLLVFFAPLAPDGRAFGRSLPILPLGTRHTGSQHVNDRCTVRPSLLLSDARNLQRRGARGVGLAVVVGSELAIHVGLPRVHRVSPRE